MSSANVIGCILGTAVGDALGLPYEGLTPRRAARLLGDPCRYRFIGRLGMVSDDTEHTLLVAQALIASAGEPEAFTRELARRMRLWAACVPAGIGLATLRASFKLWLGFPPSRSGVFSAGNGPAMRSAVIGAAVGDLDRLRELVRRSTSITHTDPKARHGALAVALAARHARKNGSADPARFLEELRAELQADGGEELVALAAESIEHSVRGGTTEAYAERLRPGKGVSGYVYHTVAVALHAWTSYRGDLPGTLGSVVRCGGDTDTAAAITGGILGSGSGAGAIPEEWLTRLVERPRTVRWMESLGAQLARVMETGRPEPPLDVFIGATLARNLIFLVVVLAHGLRRVFPPYG